MITQLITQIKKYWQAWVKKRNNQGNPQVLTSQNIYILPSAFGWAYGIVIIILFLIAINYQINTIFLMVFLLVTVGIVSAFEAHANLKNLSIRCINIEDAQQGTPAKIILFIETDNKNRFGIDFQVSIQPKARLERIPPEGIHFIIPIETKGRGYFLLPPIVISSLFPFGIFKVWSYAYFEKHYYVYPQPLDPGFWPTPFLDQDIKNKYVFGNEEFYELKLVENPWDEPNRIAWKIAAKSQGWYLKTMANNEADYWLFKLNEIPSNNLEEKLQNLSYFLQTAEASGLIYGLELTSSPIKFSHGKDHLYYCLRQLALHR